MIIIDKEQGKLIADFDFDGTKTFKELKAFIDGMDAMMELVDKKLKAER